MKCYILRYNQSIKISMKYNIMLMGALILLQIGKIVASNENYTIEPEVGRPVYYPHGPGVPLYEYAPPSPFGHAYAPWVPHAPWARHDYGPVFVHTPFGLPITWPLPGYAPWLVHAPFHTQWVKRDFPEYCFSSLANGGYDDYEYNDSGSDTESVREEEQDAPEEPPVLINYDCFLEFRKMTYDSPTSWASIL